MFPQEKKVEAAAIYAVTGSIQRTAELSGVPYDTVKGWRQTDEFKALLREVWEENNEKIDAKFTEIIEKSLEQVLDRVENGDFRLNGKGELKRVPVSAKDLSLVQAINTDKRQLLRGLPTSRSEGAESNTGRTVDRLERLAETFENLARLGRKPIVVDVEDAQIIESGSSGERPNLPASEGRAEGEVQTGEAEWQAVQTTSETTDTSTR